MHIDPEQRDISADELRQALERGDPVMVLDIRRAADRSDWSIPGSDYLDIYDAIGEGDSSGLERFAVPAGHLVVTVCYRGNNSMLAAMHLRRRGVPAVSLAGGMQAWSLMWNTADVPVPGEQVRVVQVRRTGKGCLSYLVAGAGRAAVIDPAVHPGVFRELAAAGGWTITHVIDTHVHADHLSRARVLAHETDAALILPAQDRLRFPFTPVSDGDEFPAGPAVLRAIATPGHSPESMSFLLNGTALFTGDTLFLGSVGRPDLAARADHEARRRAMLLFRSIHRLRTLPSSTLVLPGHTPEPVPFDRQPVVATLGDAIAAARIEDCTEQQFVDSLLRRIPDPPANHLRVVTLNEAGTLPLSPEALEVGGNRCAVK